MPFAPHEIENKRFVTALRGYQTDEVEAFLRAVAADYRELVHRAASSSSPQLVAEIERVMRSAREEAERQAAEVRAAAEREAAELREATQREAEACFAEIARQAEELHRLEASLWARVHALEHAVVEARQTLGHVADIYPVAPAPSLAVATNTGEAIAAR
jgi:DivIVA domain-containing protein